MSSKYHNYIIINFTVICVFGRWSAKLVHYSCSKNAFSGGSSRALLVGGAKVAGGGMSKSARKHAPPTA